jgi:hypothetical protein
MDPPQGVNPNGARMDTPRESYDSHGGLFVIRADVTATAPQLTLLCRAPSPCVLLPCAVCCDVSPFPLTMSTRRALEQALPQSTSPQQLSSHKPPVACVNQGRPL